MAYTIVNPLQEAHAVSVTIVSNGATVPIGVLRVSNKIFTSSSTDLKIFSATSPYTLLATLTTVTASSALYANNEGTRVYAVSATTLFEIDPVQETLLRTLSTGCTGGGDSFYDADANRLYCDTSTNTIVTINTVTMSVLSTSTTLNTGGSACNGITDLWYDSGSNTMFASCITNDRIVAVEGFTISGTPDFFTSYTDGNCIAFSENYDNIIAGSTTAGITTNFYNYTAGVGFSAVWTSPHTSLDCDTDSITYDPSTERYIAQDSLAEQIVYFDTRLGTKIGAISTGGTPSMAGEQVSSYSSVLQFMGSSGTSFYIIDSTGIAEGSGAGGIQGASICYVDTNFDGIPNIVYRDIGGPAGVPDSAGNGGVPDGVCDGASAPLTGGVPLNQTGGQFGCIIGLIPCTNGVPDNPNLATNGLGYLFVIILLAIMIGLFALAHTKTGLDVPDWLFIVGTFAVLGASMAFGWIDSTLFVIGVVIVAGLASTKFISKLSLGGFR